MSFFEDYVEEGSHCASCCQFIGADVGYIRYCRECEPDHKPKAAKLKPMRSTDQHVIAGLTKTQRRREQKKRAQARLKVDPK